MALWIYTVELVKCSCVFRLKTGQFYKLIYMKLLGNDGSAIKDIKNPTYEMRLRAVAQKRGC